MSIQNYPLVSVALESYNADSNVEISLEHVLKKLRAQTYPQERIEVVVVVEETNDNLRSFLESNFPWIRMVMINDPGYYAMKVRGMEAASGDLIALTDADCDPPSDYVERLVSNFNAGADVVVGKVRFTPGVWYSKTFDLFCFAHIKADETGFAQAFSVNNVAFARVVAQKHTFDPRIRRSGGAYLLCRQLRKSGYRVMYDPGLIVFHDVHDLHFQIMMRIRTGYEVVNLLTIDENNILPEAKFKRFGVFAPVVSSARRFLIDIKNVVTDRRELDISIYQFPYFFFASFVVRGVEAAAGILTVFRPRYLPDRYGW